MSTNGETKFFQVAKWMARSVTKLLGAAFAAADCSDERPLQDTDLMGEYNHRTGRLDAGTDPNGWYEED